jgi:hypothetical protein
MRGSRLRSRLLGNSKVRGSRLPKESTPAFAEKGITIAGLYGKPLRHQTNKNVSGVVVMRINYIPSELGTNYLTS